VCVCVCVCVCVFPVFCSTPIINLRAELPLTRSRERETELQTDRTSVGGSVFSISLTCSRWTTYPQNTHTHTHIQTYVSEHTTFIVPFVVKRVVFLSLSFPPHFFFFFVCSFHRCEMLAQAHYNRVCVCVCGVIGLSKAVVLLPATRAGQLICSCRCHTVINYHNCDTPNYSTLKLNHVCLI